MKNHKTGFLVLMLSLASAFLLQSCNDTPSDLPTPPEQTATITVPSAITLSGDGSSAEVEVTLSNDAVWSASVVNTDATWCSLTPMSGKGSGKFMVTAAANEDRTARSIDIAITTGFKTATVTINQKDTLGVNAPDVVMISNDGGTTTIDVQANTLWEIRKADLRANWIEFTPNHGTGKGDVTFTLQPNTLLAERSVEIIFSAGNATRVITVSQQNIKGTTYLTDSVALVALYNATDGKGWSNPWNLKQPISTWKGVTLEDVDGKLRVTALALPSRQLDGSVPLELGNLICLRKLDLSFNSLKGDLPEQIGNLTQLTELNLAANKFVGAISHSVTKLIGLTRLDLNRNRFNTFPVEICQLEHLEAIYLGDNELTALPGEVLQMSNLEYLYLDNNFLTALPSGLDKMPNLIYLHASHNKIKGALPPEIGNMAQLQSLRLEYNEFSGSIPSSYANLSSLEYIYLNDNDLTGSLPDMSQMINLKTLHMSKNRMTGDIPTFGKNGLLSALTQIFLSDNQLTGQLTEDIRNLTDLEVIYIDHNLLNGMLPLGALSDKTHNYPSNPSWESYLYLNKLTALVLNDNQITGSVPVGLVERLEAYNPSFNTSGFKLNNNNLTGPLDASFKGLATRFNFVENLYPQRNGVVLSY